MKNFILGVALSTILWLTVCGLLYIDCERTKNNELETMRKERYEALLKNAKLQKEINRLYTREVRK